MKGRMVKMYTLRKIIELYENGAFNIEIQEDMSSASIGGVVISVANAEKICEDIGWGKWNDTSGKNGYRMHPYTIIDKTRKFIKGIKGHITDDRILDNTTVDFKNNYTRIHNKFCDKIHLVNKTKGVEYSVIYNMPDNPAKYTVYSAGSIVVGKCTTLKKLGEYINNNL